MTLDSIQIMEESLIDELRRRLKGQMSQAMYENDHLFRRFLRARKHSIDASETMLRNHVNWRKQHKIDTILTDRTLHPILTSEYFTLSRLGTDIDGSPVSYLHFGALDTKGLLNCCSVDDIQEYVVHYFEREYEILKKLNEKGGKLVDKCVYIFNFENFSLASATHKGTLEAFIALLKMYEANYPEHLKTGYAINVSYYFTLVWMAIKQFLSPETVNKVRIFGKTGWQEDIHHNVHPDVLPAFLGGNRTDPDGNPMCKTVVRFGGPIPEKCYAFENQNCTARLPGAQKLTVNRVSKSEVTLQVLYPGSVVEWEFVVKSRDVAFSVLFKENCHSSLPPKVIIPSQRIETVSAVESGRCNCEKAGIYIIEFDNTYSWMYSKEIYYTASVVSPQKQNA